MVEVTGMEPALKASEAYASARETISKQTVRDATASNRYLRQSGRQRRKPPALAHSWRVMAFI